MSSQKRRRIQTDDSDDDEPFQPAVDTEAAKGDSDVDYDNNSDDDDNGNNSDSNNNDGSRRNVMRPYLDRMNRRAAGEAVYRVGSNTQALCHPCHTARHRRPP